MKSHTVLGWTALAFLLLMIAGLWALAGYYTDLPNRTSQHETVLLGQSAFTPGHFSALRVVVRDSKNGAPLPHAEINVSLRSAGGETTSLYTGTTNGAGHADVAFQVPEDASADATLVVETSSELGKDTLERSINIQRNYRVLLTTDKPIYQPGQTIHMRALALSTFDLVPSADTPLELTIADGKGNKVFRQVLVTSEFGVAFADFPLANEVNTGNYKISAMLSGVVSEKTVVVEYYDLPKFAVKLSSDSPFYLPGQSAHAVVSAEYFYGKPVAAGQVAVEGYTLDVERTSVFEIQGATDAEGDFAFDFDLPVSLAGSEMDNGNARLYLQASVVDRANHTETVTQSLPVAQQGLIIQAIFEGGQFRPNLENILYVLTAYPDGAPAPTSLSLYFQNGFELAAETGPYGLAEIRLKPDAGSGHIEISAQDGRGTTATRQFDFQGDYQPETVLLRPEHPVYRVGDTMNLTVLSSQPEGTLYLDFVRQGQTLSTRVLDVRDGRADVAVDLSPNLYGTLEIHAYKILPGEEIIRDTRLVVVDNANDLQVTLRPGQETYHPGGQAGLDIQVTGQDDVGVRSALGLAIVDESVFALAGQQPGFARLYFLLEQELLAPKYDIHGFSVPDLVLSPYLAGDPQLQRSYEGAAFAALASAVPQKGLFTLHASSHAEAVQRLTQLRREAFIPLFKALIALAWVIAICVFILTITILARRGRFGATISILSIVAAVCVGLAFVWYPLALLALALLALSSALGLFILIAQAFTDHDQPLGFVIGLVVAYAAILFVMVSASRWGGSGSNSEWSVLVSILVVLGSLLLLVVGTTVQTKAPSSTSSLSMLLLVVFLASCSPAMPTSVPAPAANPLFESREQESAAKAESEPAGQEEPRLRQYFPETMLWLPDAVTGEDGRLHLDFPVADSITTWRMTALASTKDGRLGSTTAGLRVFQDFFVDVDLPLSLTVGDEISVPVGVYNYQTTLQAVRLELEQPGWFELLDEPVKEIEIAANDIQVVSFRVRVTQFGPVQPFTVTARGSTLSDAVQRTVRVFPDGKEITFSQSDRLSPRKVAAPPVNFPSDVIHGTSSLRVKIYPGVFSQVVEGLDSILHMPNGCFEQTSTTTYPDVLVLDYLKTTGQVSPEIQMKAEQYVNVGYQRLTTFEVPSGGFSLFGGAPADRMLTAYGLQEFSDMRRVHPVDGDLIARTAEWLLSQQAPDGSWEPDGGMYHESGTWNNLRNNHLPTTAYVVWSLINAGHGADARTQKGVAYLLEHQAEAEDAYVLGLLANALVSHDTYADQQLAAPTLERLASLAQWDGDVAYWRSGVATFMGGQGTTASIETTALAALALQRGGSNAELANGALLYLVRQKDSFGTWYSTQSTIWSLKALLESVRSGTERANAAITVRLNGSQTRTVQVSAENAGVIQMLTFDDLAHGENSLEIEMEGAGSLMYQVTGSYYLPWDKLAASPSSEDGSQKMILELGYDRTKLQVEDTVQVNVTAGLTQTGSIAQSAMIDLGVPPGFTVLTEDLDALVAASRYRAADDVSPAIERYELSGRQILIYVTNLRAESPLAFQYRLRARFPVKVQSPASSAYDYYNPQINGETPPRILEINP